MPLQLVMQPILLAAAPSLDYNSEHTSSVLHYSLPDCSSFGRSSEVTTGRKRQCIHRFPSGA